MSKSIKKRNNKIKNILTKKIKKTSKFAKIKTKPKEKIIKNFKSPKKLNINIKVPEIILEPEKRKKEKNQKNRQSCILLRIQKMQLFNIIKKKMSKNETLFIMSILNIVLKNW
jgi:hypothetical protein